MVKDRIYADDETATGSFEFNDAVARVFPDMLRRSIPGYRATIAAIGALAARYVQPHTRCYDLGCSLGAATLAMRGNIRVPGCRIIAVDNAPAMVERCREAVAQTTAQATAQAIAQEAFAHDDTAADGPHAGIEIDVVEGDIREVAITGASMVVMNYTLQFLPLDEREAMIARIHAGMVDGGILVLSEIVVAGDTAVEDLLVELHHDFKRENAYSDMEISRKRTALEDVLVPETLAAHEQRLSGAGFSHVGVWLKHFNFVSLVAIR